MEESAQILEVETFIPMLLQNAENGVSRIPGLQRLWLSLPSAHVPSESNSSAMDLNPCRAAKRPLLHCTMPMQVCRVWVLFALHRPYRLNQAPVTACKPTISKQVKRLKRVMLIGDHHQLPPVVKNRAFQSLFCTSRDSQVRFNV